MTFKPGGDSTKFIGTEGWVRISRGGWDAEPKSLLTAKLGPQRRPPDREPEPKPELHRRGEGPQGRRQPPGRCRPQRHHQPHLRHRHPVEAEDTWDPKQEQIVGDAEATKLLCRPMRAPWTI